MKQVYFFLLLCGMFPFLTNCQGLYEPRNVKLSYESAVRSRDGFPGKNYWQNRATYDIELTANPPDRRIKGKENITYINNSPDTLRRLVFKLFLNMHKPGAPRNSVITQDYITSGVNISKFMVQGKEIPWESSPYYASWQPVRLPVALPPGGSISMSLDWDYEISLQSGREGIIDSTTYFFAYFYPRVAVYDDLMGWDTMDFTDEQEFYSDFNDYKVQLHLPANYIAWGTGSLMNPAEVLQPDFAARYLQSLQVDSTVHVVTAADLASKSITKTGPVNTWKFEAKDIPDVAFGISDHFVWDAGSVVVDKSTGRRAGAQAAYNDSAADYHHMVDFAKHALEWLSTNWPGIAYPYEKTTVFQGYAGMEYPMMANDETYGDTIFSRFVAEHEIAHTYMPFYMGINETRYAFMDEGWATTFEYLIAINDLGPETAANFFKQFRVNGWIGNNSALSDIPIITPGDELKNAYGNNAYGKPALGYLALKDMLGDVVFKKALHEYMAKWHGKHPSPWDFFYIMNTATGKDLNWFWRSWFFEPNYIDQKLIAADKTSKGYKLTIGNVGGMPAPVDVEISYADGSKSTQHFTSEIWQPDIKKATLNVNASKPAKSVRLTTTIWVDANQKDNQINL